MGMRGADSGTFCRTTPDPVLSEPNQHDFDKYTSPDNNCDATQLHNYSSTKLPNEKKQKSSDVTQQFNKLNYHNQLLASKGGQSDTPSPGSSIPSRRPPDPLQVVLSCCVASEELYNRKVSMPRLSKTERYVKNPNT